MLGNQLERSLRIVGGRFDLAAMTDDAGILQQTAHVARAELRDQGGIEILEGLPEVLALAEDGDPAEPGLKSFEANLLEQPAIVGDRPPPLVIVIPDVQLVFARPPAALHFLLTFFVLAVFRGASDSSCALTRLNSARTIGSTSG